MKIEMFLRRVFLGGWVLFFTAECARLSISNSHHDALVDKLTVNIDSKSKDSITSLPKKDSIFVKLDGNVKPITDGAKTKDLRIADQSTYNPNRIIQISAGGDHSCALTQSGTAYCWGSNTFGQLGDNTFGGSGGGAVKVVTVSDLKKIVAGYRYSCGLRANNSVWCWGQNDRGQLTNDDLVDRAVPTAIKNIPGAVKDIGLATYNACALLQDNRVFCWGQDYATNGAVEKVVSGILYTSDTFLTIPSMAFHRCLVANRSQGKSLWCWGTNGSGELGQGVSGTGSSTPLMVSLPSFYGAAVGWFFSCALTTSNNDNVYCWGKNDFAQLGKPVSAPQPSPALISNLAGISEITLGQFHACAKNAVGKIYCWGSNEKCQLGAKGSSGTCLLGPLNDQKVSSTPLELPLINDAEQISAGYSHNCALRKTNQVFCWGSNSAGECGALPLSNGTTPIQVSGLP